MKKLKAPMGKFGQLQVRCDALTHTVTDNLSDMDQANSRAIQRASDAVRVATGLAGRITDVEKRMAAVESGAIQSSAAPAAAAVAVGVWVQAAMFLAGVLVGALGLLLLAKAV